jgi:hypothetical protein
MTDTPPADRPVDDPVNDPVNEPQSRNSEFDADALTSTDPTLSNVSDSIDDAKDSARKIFGEKEADADDEHNADEDLGGSAPVP